MTQGEPWISEVEVDDNYRQRPAYLEGRITDAPDLSIYDQLNRVRRYLTQRRYLPDSSMEPLIASGKLYADHRGYDTDEAGERAAVAMIALHPSVKRLQPPAHDWNDALVARLSNSK